LTCENLEGRVRGLEMNEVVWTQQKESENAEII